MMIMNTIFSIGTILMVGSLCVNAATGNSPVQDQQLDRLNLPTEQHKPQDSKQFDQIDHKMAVNTKDVSNDPEQPVDDDCE